MISYRPELRTQVVRVQKDLWGENLELNAAYLEWKHLRNPYLSEPLIYLAMYGDHVVGMRSFVGSKWQFGFSRQSAVLLLESDAVVAPEHRNQGLVSLIMEKALKDLAEKGYSYTLSMGTRPVVLGSNMKLGWRTIGSLDPLGRTGAQPESLSGTYAAPGKFALIKTVYRELSAGERRSQPSQFELLDGVRDRCNGKLDDHISMGKNLRIVDVVRLKNKIDCDHRIRHVQDEVYYEWRLQNPRSTYRFLFWDDSELEGYLILQSMTFNQDGTVNLVDWCAISDEILGELLEAAIPLMSGQMLALWGGTLTRKERRIFEAANFKPQPQEVMHYPWLAATRPVRDEMLADEWLLGEMPMLDMTNWDFRMLHSRAF